MGTQNQAFSAKKLLGLTSLILFWSSRGFQNYLESGAFHDMVEAIKKGKPGTILFHDRSMYRLSDNPGDMTLGQVRKVIDLAPEDYWDKFFLSFNLWSNAAGWWEKDPVVNWELRDEWRVEMKLERLNPIRFLGLTGKHVVFRRTGHGRPPKEPSGYRYAVLEELWRGDFPEELPIAINSGGNWVTDPVEYKIIIDPDAFFHHHAVFVPLVKL